MASAERMALMAESGQGAPSFPGLWRALRANPHHAAEIAVLYTLPQLSPHMEKWWSKKAGKQPSVSSDVAARRVLRHSRGPTPYVPIPGGSWCPLSPDLWDTFLVSANGSG
jgi:hypothetical protein